MQNNANGYAKVVAKSWSDPEFRSRLIADPRKALESEGWTVPPSVKIEIKPDSSEHHFVLGLPAKPEGLSDEALTKKMKDFVCVHWCADEAAPICFC